MPTLNDPNDPSQVRISALSYPGMENNSVDIDDIFDEIPAEYNPKHNQNNRNTTGNTSDTSSSAPKQ